MDAIETFADADEGFAMLALREAELLRAFADLAGVLADADDREGSGFSRLLAFGYARRILDPETVAGLGRVDRSTASRWIGGTAVPGPLTRMLVLGRISKTVGAEATRLPAP